MPRPQTLPWSPAAMKRTRRVSVEIEHREISISLTLIEPRADSHAHVLPDSGPVPAACPSAARPGFLSLPKPATPRARTSSRCLCVPAARPASPHFRRRPVSDLPPVLRPIERETLMTRNASILRTSVRAALAVIGIAAGMSDAVAPAAHHLHDYRCRGLSRRYRRPCRRRQWRRLRFRHLVRWAGGDAVRAGRCWHLYPEHGHQ